MYRFHAPGGILVALETLCVPVLFEKEAFIGAVGIMARTALTAADRIVDMLT